MRTLAGQKIGQAITDSQREAFETQIKAELDASDKRYNAAYVIRLGPPGPRLGINLAAALQRQFLLSQADTARLQLARGLISPQRAQQTKAWPLRARVLMWDSSSQIRATRYRRRCRGPLAGRQFIGHAGQIRMSASQASSRDMASPRCAAACSSSPCRRPTSGLHGHRCQRTACLRWWGVVTLALVAGLTSPRAGN